MTQEEIYESFEFILNNEASWDLMSKLFGDIDDIKKNPKEVKYMQTFL